MPRTFYIDNNAVNDSANGTSTSTPWKRCPGMVGFSNAVNGYAHQTGDRFIFKGGVTWPSSCFTLTINNAGSTGTPDYYGGGDTAVDAVAHTWFSGGAWTKPQFDFNSTSGSAGYGILITALNVQIDNIEFYRYLGPGWFGSANIAVQNGDSNFVTPSAKVTNSHFRSTIGPATCYTGLGCTAMALNCEFEQFEQIHYGDICNIQGSLVALDTVPNVVCCYNISVVGNCYFHDTVNACLGGGYVYNSEFSNMRHAYSTAGDVHGNCIEPFTNCDIFGCKIHDLAPTIEAIITDPQQPSLFRMWNNLIWNSGGKGISLDNRRAPLNSCSAKIYNNTIVSGGAIGADKYLLADFRNNHLINGSVTMGTNVTTINDHNLIQSSAQAAAAGYTLSNLFRPTSLSSPTVDVGVSLSLQFATDILNIARPQGGLWDLGAYEFVSGGGGDTTPPSVGISSPASGATVSGTISVTATASDNVGVASVEFLVDGTSKSTDSSSPYSYSLDTTAFADGSHTIQAVARDAAGNSSSATVTVTFQNAVATAILSVSPSTAFSFGSVAANGTPNDTTYTVSNSGPAGTTLTGTATVASPFSVVSGGSYSLAAGVSQAVTVRYRPTTKANDSASLTFTGGSGTTRTLTGICYPVLTGLGPHNASSGIVTAPFAVSNTTDVSQSSETLTVAASGRVSFGINVATPGNYRLDVVVNAPSDGSNSFFSNIDAEPTTPGMISDIVTITTGFETRALSWRGAGAFDAPEFSPKAFTLSSGLHEVIIRGREANTILRSVQLVSLAPPPPPALTVSTTATPSSGVSPLTVAFTSTVSGGTSPYSYAWAFGDAGTSTSASPSHTYSGAGTYNAVLTVTDSASSPQTATATTTIPVTAPPPTPITLSISASPDTGTTPLAVDFTSVVSGGTAPYTYAWTFDDSGATSTSANPSHTYNSAGTYHPSLVVTDSSTSPQTATRSITITDSAPPPSPLGTGISATPNRDVVPLSVAFEATPGGGTGPYSFAWDFGDSVGTSADRIPSYVYTVPGDYVVHLTVTDSGSPAQTAQAMVQITALPLPLTLVVTAAPPNGVAPLAVDFAGIPAGGVSPYTYAWTFGDAGTSSTARPSHTYSAAGTYTASCTVTDSASVTASTQLTVAVSAASSDPLVPAILYVVP